jgi:DNA-binding CsgD family transcriptional regulator
MEGNGSGEDVRVSKFSMTQLAIDLDEQWPSLKYLGFGCYYAWIYLCYNSDVLFNWSSTGSSSVLLTMYLVSTTGLSLVLILAALFHKKATPLIEGRAFTMVMALVATASTVMLSCASPLGPWNPVFLSGSFLTGVGTAFVALRLGSVYSSVVARQAFMYTAGSFLFAGMLYFVAVGIPFPANMIVTACLPLLAALFSLTANAHEGERHSRADRVSIRELPSGFFFRLVLVIAVFSIVGGLVKGIMAVDQPFSMVNDSGSIIVFATGMVAIVLFLAVGVTVRDFDISRLYYPVIILACLGILAVPLLGTFGVVQGQFVGVAYNLFILVVWCLLAHVSNRTDLPVVQVFGWGRGASGAGTTVGWAIGAASSSFLQSNPSAMVGLAVGMVFVLLIVSMVVLNERTIGLALLKTRSDEDTHAPGEFFPSAGLDRRSSAPESSNREGTWTKSCNELADRCKLSDRERDVLFLLSKGRTIDFISNELGISFNTAKSHIRHVYVKVGVHSRQELLDIIEAGRRKGESA